MFACQKAGCDSPWDSCQVCLEYLERYYVLIAFASYLLEPSFDATNPGHLPFGRWLAQRPELQRCAVCG